MIFVNGNVNELFHSAEQKKLVLFGATPFISKLCESFQSFDILGRIDFVADTEIGYNYIKLNDVVKPFVEFGWFLRNFPYHNDIVLLFIDIQYFLKFLSMQYQLPQELEFFIGMCLLHNPPTYSLPMYNPETDSTKIPKILHYCWFGGNPVPSLHRKCIESWKKFCPDYEIIEWNDKNYDITKSRYMKEAYAAKKWAFVSDYARLDVLLQYGGVYIDTDVELLKPIDRFLCDNSFCGLESPGVPALGLPFGAAIGNELIRNLRDIYNTMTFLNDDGSFNMTPITAYHAKIFKYLGLTPENKIQKLSEMTVYPTDVFCPLASYLSAECFTEKTHAIHHYAWSWGDVEMKANKFTIAEQVRKILTHFSRNEIYHFPLPDMKVTVPVI